MLALCFATSGSLPQRKWHFHVWFGSCLPVTFLEEVSQNCFVLQVFNMQFGRKSRTRGVFERKCCAFQYKGWLRTWQVKLCGTTVAERPRVMLGSCSNRPIVIDGIPLRFATPGWFPHCKCDCKCCWWMSCRWKIISLCLATSGSFPQCTWHFHVRLDHVLQLHFWRTSRRIASLCRCSTCSLEGSLVQDAL